MSEVVLGVVGGSGLYDMGELTDVEERVLETPFGSPSDAFVLGSLGDVRIGFLARHGRGHRILPSELNHRANVWAFKRLGVEYLLSVSAVGSMQIDYRPTDIVVPDQFIDWTRRTDSTFFGDGLVGHVSMAQPVSEVLRGVLVAAARRAGARVHDGGVYLCMQGPQFSTRAESELYRSWGVDVIGMTNAPEAKLAREAEICYATLAMVTDYDCWHEEEEAVTVEGVLEVLRQNSATAQDVIRRAARKLAARQGQCDCADALATALVTDPARVPAETLARLEPIVGRYFGVSDGDDSEGDEE